MNKDVIVSVKGIQILTTGPDDGGEPEVPIEITVPGTFYEKDGTLYCLYEEINEEFNGTTKNSLKLKDNCFELTKRGTLNVQMEFKPGERTSTTYILPFGSIMMGIDTSEVVILREENCIFARARYSLEISGEKTADCSIEIKIKSKN